ncbi:flagellar export chaperone FliS [Thalassospira sp. MA62]|nr:flagellar export chaperone FliS [Thalassospira sp. MA62]
MNEHAAHTYKQQQVNTATPAKMVFMLFERTLSRLNEAKRAIESNNIQARCNANCNAQELIAHLSGTLDMQQGGEIAANLDRLYQHCLIRLMDVDRHNDIEAANEVITLLTPIRDSWAALAEKSEAELRQAIMSVQENRPAAQLDDNVAVSTAEERPDAPAKPGLSISA